MASIKDALAKATKTATGSATAPTVTIPSSDSLIANSSSGAK